MHAVLIVDECPIFRYGVKQLLETGIGHLSVDECSTLGTMPSPRTREGNWDVLILGPCPGVRELDLVRNIKLVLPTVRILLISGRAGHQAAVQAVNAGVCGFVTKKSSLAELVRAFREVLSGANYISEQPLLTSADSLPHTKLSKREHMVLTAIAAGKRTNEIACELNLDARTISTYRRRVLAKMEMNSNADLIRYMAEHELG